MTHPEASSPEGAGTEDRSDAGLRILHSIRRITRAADLYSKKLVVDFGITAPQLLVLDEIVAKGAMMVRSVAAEIHLSSSTLVGIVDRLEAKGLARRERALSDRRKVMVVPTEAGRSLAAESPSALQGHNIAFLAAKAALETYWRDEHILTAHSRLVRACVVGSPLNGTEVPDEEGVSVGGRRGNRLETTRGCDSAAKWVHRPEDRSASTGFVRQPMGFFCAIW